MTHTEQQPTPVPLLDVGRQNDPLRDEIQAAIASVCDSGQFVLGPEVVALEQEIAAQCDVPHAVGCASGSDALLLALMAVGVGEGDEVILPSFTFFATASAVWRLGAKPVFIDIDADSFNIDVALIEQAITSKTKAILPVHLFGQAAEMETINALAKQHDLAVIEDAAQAIGASYDGRPVGALGDIACFSFYPTKNLGGFGDAGMLTTRDEALADRLRLLRSHGMRPRYYHQAVGINSRLDSIQAAVLRVKLRHLDNWSQQRGENAARYTELFANAEVSEYLIPPPTTSGCGHVWNQYTLRVKDGQRDTLRAHLAEQKIGTEIYYPVPLHQQECFASLGYTEGSLPVTEQAAIEALALPIFPELRADEQKTVVEAIGQFFAAQKTPVAEAAA